MRLAITGLQISFGARRVVDVDELPRRRGRDRRAGRGERVLGADP